MTDLSSLDKNMSILIVDDFSTMRKIVRNCLEELGFSNVQEAEDGDIALEKVREGRFDLIVSDWNMPNMMGLDLLKAIRSAEETKDLHFLMVTAEAQKSLVIEAARAGVSNYIVKPFTPKMLREKIAAMFVNL